MDAERTELAWTFTPEDLFEAGYEGTHSGAELSIGGGKAIVRVSGSQPSAPAEEALKHWVVSVLRVKAIQSRMSFELSRNATATEFKDGTSHIYVRVESAVVRVTAGRVDVVQTTPAARLCAIAGRNVSRAIRLNWTRSERSR